MTLPVDLERLRAALVRGVRTKCPPWLAADAEDIAHAAIVRVLERERVTGGAVQFSAAYFYRATYSAMIDEIRRRRGAPIDPVQDEPPDPPPSTAPYTDPKGRAELEDLKRALRDCLAALAVDRRRAVTLDLQEHSLAEIADLLGWNRKKADNLVSRGRQDLRACMEAHGFAP